MKSSDIRAKFLKYFESKGHKILPGSSLVPKDPTVLLTLAGMLQFKPIFLGQEKADFARATTVQKCLRTNDVEQVGKTLRHHTFFEMLGNFSFGDYFKKEAIEFAWDFLIRELGLPKEKLFIAVYEKDDEAYDIWLNEIKISEDHIKRLDEENNFWAAGPTGPCGPCSEIYYDLGPRLGCGKPDCAPGCDCDRFLEVWNLVFMEFNRNDKGELIPLKNKNIDTGMGLERIASIMQGVDSNFETDLFVPLINKVQALSPQKSPSQQSLRIIADHARATAHLIGDGVFPANVGRGYILRRLIRRAVRHGKMLELNEPFVFKLAQEVVAQMKAVYPVLKEKEKSILQIIETEEENFFQTLEQGLSLFNDLLNKYQGERKIPGEAVFKLHDTYGFPVELTREIALEKGFSLDEQGFAANMEAQKERARSAGSSDAKKDLAGINLDSFKPTKFDGYEQTAENAKVLAVFEEKDLVILDKTPFYGESGGQVGDTGLLNDGERTIKVVDTLITPKKVILHKVKNIIGLKENTSLEASVDQVRRQAISIHHTATHLLHKALQEVLGGHVKQAGSYVGPDKLRFDFSHISAVTPEELAQVEDLVNKKIKEHLKVEVLNKSYKDAVKMGAMALFGEKYGDKVRVLKIADYSLELCGGTHVRSTADIYFFRIVNESSLGAGLRRIEAVAGQVAISSLLSQVKADQTAIDKLIVFYRDLEHEKGKLGNAKFVETDIFEIETGEIESLNQALDRHDSKHVRNLLDHLAGRVEWLNERIQKVQKEIRQLKLTNVSAEAGTYLAEIIELGEVKVLLKEFKDYDMQMLREISDTIKGQAKSCVLVLATSLPNRVIFLITVTPDLVSKGYSAKLVAEVFSRVIGGKGGGKDEKVEGGGKDPAKIKAGFDKVLALLALPNNAHTGN
ncbi:alanine--tRNA ligase [candidate division WOR-1 bacterium RIFOXYB2_FULL_42_35]|uniref:Alanine--tRNA ligase n=1 Tax=candidate division WOR-1 bacterium RIFOXYC2_FULL_41_25 TaxID=1802586 RepID=A0A1F4TQA1_UNCSA|nr:MAG: alanine--tRNA ligase [candidate division WOR-1 bacterium RIFOXYA2_FULL_41_14]OGC25452.1 MAG: alanine--tRNA ligase [candidate division WOR-1 bacterium RIFOXYB2_FULL_42_35]OGC34858.1 MAG: alanine--tRNA ligase [candidate division WOR-1 bacterium RIFOXYC2_FULL_41_25]OGC42967.1 MAG: alanine--tRNA ligase [candidate division WOR-1 bacterium RIFOXYD2_FULL_41_8]